MNKIAFILALINILFLAGCQTQSDTNENVPGKEYENVIPESEDIFREISVDSVIGLSCEEVLELCRDVVGKKDDETFLFQMAEFHTGRNIGYRCDGAFESNGKQFYLVSMLWSSDEDAVWSAIGQLGVSADGSEIYEVLRCSDSTYFPGKLLWKT